MTLNGPYFALFHRIQQLFRTYYVTLVEDKPLLSAEYGLWLLAKNDPPCSAASVR